MYLKIAVGAFKCAANSVLVRGAAKEDRDATYTDLEIRVLYLKFEIWYIRPFLDVPTFIYLDVLISVSGGRVGVHWPLEKRHG